MGASFALAAVVLALVGGSAVARGATHAFGAWRIEVQEATGAWTLSAGGAPILEGNPAEAHGGAELLPAGGVEVAPAADALTLTKREGAILQQTRFAASGNRLLLTHAFSCRAAARVQVVVDDAVRTFGVRLRIPAETFLGRPFSFSTIQVKEVAPYTATAPLGEKGELCDNQGAPGRGFFLVHAFSMERENARFEVRLARETTHPYLPADRAEVPRPAGTWMLRSQLKTQSPGLLLDFGDALDAWTTDTWKVDVVMTPKS